MAKPTLQRARRDSGVAPVDGEEYAEGLEEATEGGEEGEEPTEEAVEPEETVTEEAPAPVEGFVEVVLNQNLRSYFGDRFYDMQKGQSIMVPAEFKGILKKAGMLEAL